MNLCNLAELKGVSKLTSGEKKYACKINENIFWGAFSENFPSDRLLFATLSESESEELSFDSVLVLLYIIYSHKVFRHFFIHTCFLHPFPLINNQTAASFWCLAGAQRVSQTKGSNGR